ncbi:hypothetical protein [Synechococcus sp. ROS8604]|uniref:hypothetical protein n=1 Tax=Synechococcus sp. ROS8604 TaxID=1442557 RepID=UPI0016454E52|nr:hypothetical protein [Synechococcus sp. ROS8604]QNI88140.1 hypothetical protein SynROS8604_01504 [Synechococcus sp. ROS8604]
MTDFGLATMQAERHQHNETLGTISTSSATSSAEGSGKQQLAPKGRISAYKE